MNGKYQLIPVSYVGVLGFYLLNEFINKTLKVEQMNEHELSESAGPQSKKFFPFILLLFLASGCSALIYEIVWFQLLQFVIGSSSISLGVLLGIYMGGMCLGSIVLPKLISAKRHPLRVYALLEMGIGIIGIAVLYALPYVDKIYISQTASRNVDILLRVIICTVILLPPTLLMGATLPAIARWVETTRKGVSQLGFFYAGNIIGAVFGCLLAGFYLLRVHDMVIATYVAVTVNFAVCIIGLLLSKFTPFTAPAVQSPQIQIVKAPGAWAIYIAIALSGLTALGAEVVWTRLLSLMLGGTVYTFSIILAMFLVGLGVGSSLGSAVSRYISSPRLALGFCQLLLVGAIGWTAYLLSSSLPMWPIDPSLSPSPWFTFQLDMLRCLWAVFPAACLWGASFPIALASVVLPGQDSGRVVGGVYAINTIGAVIGSVCFSMIFVPFFGTQHSQQILIGLAFLSAVVVLVPVFWPFASKVWFQYKLNNAAARLAGSSFLIACLVFVILLIQGVVEIPWGLIAYGRYLPARAYQLVPERTEIENVPAGYGTPDTYCVYLAEGRDVSIAVTKTKAGILSFHGAGKVQASSDPWDMRLQRMLGHISALLNKDPKSVLVVACGAGVTAGSFVVHPEVERIVICDIEPMVPKHIAPFFAKENYDVVNDRRTEVVCDDGRHYIHTTDEKFDVITSDPIDPWVKGTAALNSEQYYQMCKEHLNPGGVMSLWMPLYESNNETVKSAISTFFKVFPNGVIWSNDSNGTGYDAVLFGMAEPIEINIDQLRERLARADHIRVAQSLQEVGFNSASSLLATYAGQARDLGPWMADAQLNTDRNMRLQYLAGMWLNRYEETEILNGILQYYSFPDNIFSGSHETINDFKLLLDGVRLSSLD